MEQVYKRNDFIVKLFACLFIAIFLVFTFIGSKVFANNDIIVNIDNIDYSIDLQKFKDKITNSNNYNYFAFFRYRDNDYINVWLFDSDVNLLIDKDWQCHLRTDSSEVTHFVQFTYYFKTSQIDTGEHYYDISNNSGDYYFGGSFSQYWSVPFANVNVYNNSISDENLVFQAPPQEQDKVLAPIVEGEEMKPLQEILQILPIVMIVIVGYLALRKGLAILFRFLRTS